MTDAQTRLTELLADMRSERSRYRVVVGPEVVDASQVDDWADELAAQLTAARQWVEAIKASVPSDKYFLIHADALDTLKEML